MSEEELNALAKRAAKTKVDNSTHGAPEGFMSMS